MLTLVISIFTRSGVEIVSTVPLIWFVFFLLPRCEDCKALFHLSCKADEQSCPRCQRMRKYMERDLQD